MTEVRSRCVVFDRPAWLMRPEVVEAWRGWFRTHGIDPHDVRLGHPVICRDAVCRVTWTGRDGARHHVQGETPAMPFPPLDPRDGFLGHEIAGELTR